MQLPHSLRFNHHVRTRNRLCDRKICTIHLPPRACAPWSGLRRMTECAVHVARVACEFAGPAGDGAVRGRVGGVVLDVWVGRGQRGECGFREAEGFGENGFGRTGEPVCEVESCAVTFTWLARWKETTGLRRSGVTYPALSKSASSNASKYSFSSSTP
jgi:hypothetical protein